ncbi:hypothetical protein CLOM_g13365 [Closterium sp. NIES-68]|nr:hypothetical protein CLOM_g13365 [Closterium sp. NIES-68]
MYGNDTMYMLFRLHHTLYERILSAKVNARASEEKYRALNHSDPPDLYARFLEVLYNLLDGQIDNTRFEDECRAAIGTQSYVLFTIDKLIYRLVKQLQACAGDEVGAKLQQLHEYEVAKGAGGYVDMVYQANACALMHDDSLYRIELLAQQPGEGVLTVQLMEGGPEKVEVPAAAMESAFLEYLWHFLHSPPAHATDRAHVFLARNVRKASSSTSKRGRSKEDEERAALESVLILNGLECKLSCVTSKVSYVLDTEDYLLRHKKKRQPKSAAQALSHKAQGTGGTQGLADRSQRAARRLRRYQQWISAGVPPASSS